MCVGNGNGAFVVAELCEALIRGDVATGRKSVKEWFAVSDVFKQVEASEGKGKNVLLEKLTLLWCSGVHIFAAFFPNFLEEDFRRAGSLNLMLFGIPTGLLDAWRWTKLSYRPIGTFSLLEDVMYDLLARYFDEISC